ncbi:hypothetical protein CVT26_004005 [Gymnopilus dilepis]|uniref:Uncharacterized protein n=1 Tax=Gymnopilus dilepis TaxID=231916 RepID=A0A409WYI2_9AGAR|nr:hypothetical protein CVT26_004005 [Gymnopilus dilepis]
MGMSGCTRTHTLCDLYPVPIRGASSGSTSKSAVLLKLRKAPNARSVAHGHPPPPHPPNLPELFARRVPPPPKRSFVRVAAQAPKPVVPVSSTRGSVSKPQPPAQIGQAQAGSSKRKSASLHFTTDGPTRKQVLVSFPSGTQVPSVDLVAVMNMSNQQLRARNVLMQVLSIERAYDGWSLRCLVVPLQPANAASRIIKFGKSPKVSVKPHSKTSLLEHFPRSVIQYRLQNRE